MPSPFPGMDPFIEGQVWTDFHLTMISETRAALIPLVRPRYVVRVEERVYLDEQSSEETVSQRGSRERFLAVRERESLELATVIEILSPTNKRLYSDERLQYLNQRRDVLRSVVHLVELDLLREGQRLPTIEPLPPADYQAFVCREQFRSQAEAYCWTVRQPLPAIPVPLAGDNPDVMLDLQATFTSAYDRAGYDYSLDYQRPVQPPLGEADAAWIHEVLSR